MWKTLEHLNFSLLLPRLQNSADFHFSRVTTLSFQQLERNQNEDITRSELFPF